MEEGLFTELPLRVVFSETRVLSVPALASSCVSTACPLFPSASSLRPLRDRQ